MRLDRGEQLLAALLHVVGEAQRPCPRQQIAQYLLAREEREGSQVVASEAEEIEEEGRSRSLDGATFDVGGAAHLRALLQALEARPATLVEHHDLAVHHHVDTAMQRTARAISGNVAMTSLPWR